MRRAVDTNVLVRILADNGSEQAKAARELLLEGTLVVSSTVLLETEWVLRSRFKLDREVRSGLLGGLLKLGTVEVEGRSVVQRALSGFAAGMDFADALHLAGSGECDELVTFDRDFARRAQAAPDAIPVRLL